MFIFRSLRMVVKFNVSGCKCLIDHGESLECDEQDALSMWFLALP
jgi:hypothetical protein